MPLNCRSLWRRTHLSNLFFSLFRITRSAGDPVFAISDTGTHSHRRILARLDIEGPHAWCCVHPDVGLTTACGSAHNTWHVICNKT